MEIVSYKTPTGGEMDAGQFAVEQEESGLPRRVNKYREIITNYLKYPEKTPKQLAQMMGRGYTSEYISQCIHRYRKTERAKRDGMRHENQQRQLIAEAVKYISNQARVGGGEESQNDVVLRLLGRILEYQIRSGLVSFADIRGLIFNTPSLRTEEEYHLFLDYFSNQVRGERSFEGERRVEVA